MSLSRLLLIALLASAPAQAQGQTQPLDMNPPSPPFIGSGEGRKLYDKAYEAMPQGCAMEDTAGKRERLAAFERLLAGASDASVKATFTPWIAQTRTWLDANAAGVPGAGTWDELRKLMADVDAGLALWQRLPAEVPVGVAKTKEKVDGFIALKALRTRVYAMIDKVHNHTTCEKFAKDYYAKLWSLTSGLSQLDQQVNAGAEAALIAVEHWGGESLFPAGAVPATYWEHVTYVFKGVEAIRKTREVQAKLETGILWAPLLPAEKAAKLQGVAEKLTKALADWGPKVAAELANVEMPPMKKDATRSKSLLRALAGVTTGKQIGAITTGGAASKDSWTEQVVVARETNGVWVRDVKNNRDYYSVYYGWKPTPETTTATELPGVATSDVCEIWTMGFARSSQGRKGPSGAFSPTDSWVLGYIPCANLTKTSKRKL